MALIAMADNGVNIPTLRDAVMYETFAGQEDFVFARYQHALECTATGLVVTCKRGECIIQGRHVTNTSNNETVTVSSNTSGYIAIRYDTTSVGNEASLVAVSELETDDLNRNDSGGVRDFPLYEYVAGASTVGLTDVRVLRESPHGADDYFVRGDIPNGADLNTYVGNPYSGIWTLNTGYSFINIPASFLDPSTGLVETTAYLEVIADKGNSTACIQRLSNYYNIAQRRVASNSFGSWLFAMRPEQNPFYRKRVIFVGDSFLAGTGASTYSDYRKWEYGWGGQIIQLFKPSEAYYAVSSGCGFVDDNGGGGLTFRDCLASNVCDTNGINVTVPDKKGIDYIIVVGGINDYTHAMESDFESKVQNFIDYCRNNYPSAKIVALVNGGRTGMMEHTSYMGYKNIAYHKIIRTFEANGIPCSEALIWWIYQSKYTINLNGVADHTHLNADGYTLLAGLITAFAAGGDITFHGYDEGIELVSENAVINSRYVRTHVNNQTVRLECDIKAARDLANGTDVLFTVPCYLTPAGNVTYDYSMDGSFNLHSLRVSPSTGASDYLADGDIKIHPMNGGTYPTADTRILVNIEWNRGEG